MSFDLVANVVNTVNAFAPDDQRRPELVRLAGGDIVVIWQSSWQDGSGEGLFARRYDAFGQALGDEFAINTTTFADQQNHSVTALEDGGFVVVWESWGQDGSRFGIFGQRFSETGAKVGAEFQVNEITAGNQIEPYVAALSDGRFVVTWSQWVEADNIRYLYARLYDADGEAIGDITRFAAGAELQSRWPNGAHSALQYLEPGSRILPHEDGGFSVLYRVNGSSFLQRQDFDADGTLAGAEQIIGGIAGPAQWQVRPFADGRFGLIESAFVAGSPTYQIRIFDPATKVLGPAVQLVTGALPEDTIILTTNMWNSRRDFVSLGDGTFAMAFVLWRSEQVLDPVSGDLVGFRSFAAPAIQRYDANLQAVGGLESVGPEVENNAHHHLRLTAAGGGAFILSWEMFGADDDPDSRGIEAVLIVDSQTGDAGDNLLTGGVRSDFLYGLEGNDTLDGGRGDDVLFGGAGDDRLIGGQGHDTLYGEAGHDRLIGGNGQDLLYGGGGNDTLFGGAGRDTLWGQAGEDRLLGGEGNDLLYGGAGNDTLFGEDGNDTLLGGNGNDRLFGGEGNDVLDGGPGNDTLDGGEGRDVLTGGAGADRFVFATASGIGLAGARDRITDFAPGEDRIDLSAIDADVTQAGNQGFAFIGGAQFSGAAGELRYRNGVLWGDVDGDGVADFGLILDGAPVLTLADLILG